MIEIELAEYRKWLDELEEQWIIPQMFLTTSSNRAVLYYSLPFPWPWKRKEIEVIWNEIEIMDAKIAVLKEKLGVSND
jgi:hypothetical protein